MYGACAVAQAFVTGWQATDFTSVRKVLHLSAHVAHSTCGLGIKSGGSGRGSREASKPDKGGGGGGEREEEVGGRGWRRKGCHQLLFARKSWTVFIFPSNISGAPNAKAWKHRLDTAYASSRCKY